MEWERLWWWWYLVVRWRQRISPIVGRRQQESAGAHKVSVWETQSEVVADHFAAAGEIGGVHEAHPGAGGGCRGYAERCTAEEKCWPRLQVSERRLNFTAAEIGDLIDESFLNGCLFFWSIKIRDTKVINSLVSGPFEINIECYEDENCGEHDSGTITFSLFQYFLSAWKITTGSLIPPFS